MRQLLQTVPVVALKVMVPGTGEEQNINWPRHTVHLVSLAWSSVLVNASSLASINNKN